MALSPRVGPSSVRLVLAILILGIILDRCHGWTSYPSLQRSSAVRTRFAPTLGAQPTSDQEDVAMEASSSAPEIATPVAAESDVSSNKPLPVSSQPPTSLSTRDMMTALGTSPRRIFLSGITGAGIALAGNLFGVTSQLLTLVPEDTVEATGLDTYFPRGPYKRFKTADYTFAMPREWVADTAIELAKAQRRSMSLDYSMRSKPMSRSSVLPDAAFGPPGNRVNSSAAAASDTNVSLIRTPTPPNFDLRQVMGEPVAGAEFLLKNFLAPAGSGRQATLLSVDETADAAGRASYRLAYTIERGDRGVPLQAIAIIAQGRATLVTMTVVAPVETWKTDFAPKLYKMADSFRLTTS